MSTKFQPLEIPAGVVAKATKQQRSSNWAEVNLMRWREGALLPVGGQSQYNYSFASRAKKIHGWYDLNQTYHIAYLCEQHLYVDTGGALTDISPVPPLTNPNPIVSGGYGDGNYSDGTYDYGEPPPISIIQALDKVPDAFSLDNFGSILYAMTSPDGRLLMWDPAVGGPAVVQPVSGTRGPVPKGRCFVVTPERFVIIFGSYADGTGGTNGGFRRFAWCDQENPGAWDYSNVTSQAGFLDIEPASPIICAISTRSGTLFWTGKTTYVSQFLGLPYIYNYLELAKNCTPWSPQSMVNTSSMAVWMSEQGAFSYDGTSVLPVQCMVRPWVDDDIDVLNVREQACLVHVGNFNEVWWFFPQNGQPYNTRCIYYSYKEGWWGMGRMARSAGITSSYTAHTIMADGKVSYQHETPSPSTYPQNVPLPWAETFDLNLNSGSLLTTVKQLIPDIDGDAANLLYSLIYRTSRSVSPNLNGATRPNPNAAIDGIVPPNTVPVSIPTIEQQTPPRQVRPDGYVDFRITGRDIRMKIQLIGPPSNHVSVGQHLIDSVPRGDR